MKVAAIIAAATVATAAPIEGSFNDIFQNFVTKFDKVYNSAAEKAERYEIFMANMKKLNELRVAHPNIAFDVNQFMDMTNEERFIKTQVGFHANLEALKANAAAAPIIADEEYPASLDYSECYPSVRDQAQCGSCWAFATAGAIEGAICKAQGKPIEEYLSPQHLVDCDKEEMGCHGASTLSGPFSWVEKRGGICTEKEYEYIGRQNGFFGFKSCREQVKCTSMVPIKSAVDLAPNGVVSTEQMVAALNKYGPLSVGVGVTTEFTMYAGGVFTAEACGETRLNHAVVAVGYETLENGKIAFKIRNSWSEKWGEAGYIRIEEGACQLGQIAVAAEVEVESAIRM